jgi:hypothetical protein
MPTFPLPFTGRLELKGGDLGARPSFIVASMFTPSHRDLATRLATSLEQLGLPFAIYEVPTVHRSISPRGTDEPGYTKANFISYVLREFQTPVLYVDCDCVFRVEPRRIRALVADGCDFAIYNWLADEHTDAFVPFDVPMADDRADAARPRLFRFSHSIDWFSPDQLICSGAVQFYANTTAARDLLAVWSAAVRDCSGVPDDQCLDYAFNFRRPTTPGARWTWLDKAYARYLFWIYARPVIDHPQIPAPGDPVGAKIADKTGAPRWKMDNAEVRTDGRLFPRDALVDADRRLILRPRSAGGAGDRVEFVPFAPLHHELFLD